MSHKLKEAGIELLHWYRENKRDLPWRQTRDPYKIWISEIMLQQTRVDTVIDYYHRFLQRFPDVMVLAGAKEEDVLSAWKGLGYYSRARNLRRAAQVVAHQYGGVFPCTYGEVRALPGIGDYTAGAVLSIGFGQPYAAVDGNVLRVISRLEGLEEDIAKDTTKKYVSKLVSDMIPEGSAGDFTQSLMELGALVCILSEPLCGTCPVKTFCTAYSTGGQHLFPVKKKRDKPVKQVHYWVALIRKDGRILMEHRKNETLLGEMWGLPLVEKISNHPVEKLLEEKYGLKLKKEKLLGCATHVFTHQVWKMDAISCAIVEDRRLASVLHWVEEDKLEELAVPVAFQRVFRIQDPKDEWEQIPMELD